ncbi:MAG TPA: ribonuclease III domain-containing protein [Candidatus Limiplasma sp.]|nr:ribonuclease III domain-containing protein [Candidatus Limiplasma sp.]HPS82541.1 ribonuclease III domain-containing protein [Candidatus Limiplasma sp.]
MQGQGIPNTPMGAKEAELKNPLALAFIGDTVWDLLVRQRLLATAARVNALHRKATSMVNAGAQAQALTRVEPLLTEAERDIVRRGANAHCNHVAPKNQDPVDYRHATGLEALIGWLYLSGQHTRVRELFETAHPSEKAAHSAAPGEADQAG